jgi:hypothetical protein
MARVVWKATSVLRRIRPLEMIDGAVPANPGAEASPAAKAERERLAKLEEEFKTLTETMRCFVLILDDKGGLGKSLMTQISFEARPMGQTFRTVAGERRPRAKSLAVKPKPDRKR